MLANPGFEQEAVGWTLGPIALLAGVDGADHHTGVRSLKLSSRYGGPTDPTGGSAISDAFGTVPGWTYAVQFHGRAVLVPAGSNSNFFRIDVKLDPAAPDGDEGSWTEIFRAGGAGLGLGLWDRYPTAWFEDVLYELGIGPCTFVATHSTTKLRIKAIPTAGSPPLTGVRGIWRFDSFEVVEGDVVKRREIKEAVIAHCAAITVANGFQFDVAESSDGYKRLDAITIFPAVQTVYGEEVKDWMQLSRKKGELELFIFIFARGTAAVAADDQADEIAGDVEKKLETKTGTQFLGLGYVWGLLVTHIDSQEVTDAASRGIEVRILRVVVTYHYDRAQP